MTAALQFSCWTCGKPLPPHGAGKCAKCAAGSGIAGLQIAPHCSRCKASLPYWPASKMAVFNPKCRCEGGGKPC